MAARRKRDKVVRAHLDPEVVARIDALSGLFSRGGRPATRAEILRALVLLGLEEEEKLHAPPQSSSRRREG